jgi:PAS domain S-box-containing protein
VSNQVSPRAVQEQQSRTAIDRHYREIIENSNIIILKWDTSGRIIYVNECAEDLFGFFSGELVGRHVIGTIVPETESSGRDLVEMIRCITNEPEKYTNNENENICKNGQRIWISWNNRLISDSGEQTPEILSIGQDITIRKRIEQELKRNEERFRSFVENANDVVFALTPEGTFSYVSPRWKDAFGYEISETIGHPFVPFVHPDDVPGCFEFLQKVMNTGEKQSGIEYRVRCKDGNFLRYKANGSRIQEADNTFTFIGIGRDITEQDHLQQEIIKTQKLESIAVLASGIAHNFNNVLTGVIGYISYARKHAGNPEKLLPVLAAAEKSSNRAADLAHQLLSFSRGGNPAKKLIPIDELVRESVSLFLTGSKVSGNVECSTHQAVYADSQQISQAFNNIILNAVHAMPEGGVLAVRVVAEVLPEGNSYSLQPGAYLKIVFTDSGCGIPNNILPKIYDPYFTTRESGTGLGLSTTLAIINRHNGRISIASEVGSGTSVTVFLPSFHETP